jgi:hypothetical protein
MDKETRLRELREQNDVHSLNAVNKNVHTDVDVVKYLDTLRRKATTIDEVDVIDLIMRSLFYEGKNKVTGRIHGERVDILTPLNKDEEPKPDRKTYHRDYMRKRRAGQKGT